MLSFDPTSAFKLENSIVSKNRTIERLVLRTAKQIMIFIKQLLRSYQQEQNIRIELKLGKTYIVQRAW